jgi:hypothetical protein
VNWKPHSTGRKQDGDAQDVCLRDNAQIGLTCPWRAPSGLIGAHRGGVGADDQAGGQGLVEASRPLLLRLSGARPTLDPSRRNR